MTPRRIAAIAARAVAATSRSLGGDAGSGRRAEEVAAARWGQSRPGGDGDLVEQVDELLHRTDEVAGSEAGHRVEYVLELGTAGPAVGRPDEAGVGLAEERQAVPLL